MDALQTSSLPCWSQERLGSMSHQHTALTGLPGEDLVTWHAAVASFWVSITSLNLVSFHCKYFPWLQLTAFRRLTDNKLNFSSPIIVTQTSAIINARPLPRNDWALKMSNLLLFMSGQKAVHKYLQNVSILKKQSLISDLISEWKNLRIRSEFWRGKTWMNMISRSSRTTFCAHPHGWGLPLHVRWFHWSASFLFYITDHCNVLWVTRGLFCSYFFWLEKVPCC